VVEAADPEPARIVWWGAMVIGISCFAAGLLLGYLLGAG
jgi:hypothetical protein